MNLKDVKNIFRNEKKTNLFLFSGRLNVTIQNAHVARAC